MKEFILPELGENIESADVLKLLVKVGDVIEKDTPVMEIETDKATIEVPSSVQGKVQEILIKEGEKAKVGQVILKVQEAEAEKVEEKIKEEKPDVKLPSEKKRAADAKPKEAGKKSITEFRLPDLGENIESADVINVLVKAGDRIEKDQAVMEIETDKAAIEVPSSISGKVIEVMIKKGEKAKVGQVIMKVETLTAEEKSAPAVEVKPPTEEKKEEPSKAVIDKEGKLDTLRPGEIDDQPPILANAAPAAPSVRRIARELGVDINQVPSSGPSGRISMDDVKSFVKKLNEGRIGLPVSPGGIMQEPLPDFSKFGPVERKPMTNIRTKTAEHLSYAWSAIPHVTQFDKADITELERARKVFNSQMDKSGVKLTVTAILLKIAASAVKAFPQFNSSIDMNKKEIIYKSYFNIGVAVDTERGLIVPVIKDVDKKNIKQLSLELNDLAEKARNRKIGLEELQGGCFTITNLGGIGGTYFTPIVNSPEVAILGVSRGNYEPIYIEGKSGQSSGGFEPRLMLPLSLSYDHRIIDGADAIRFLRWIVNALESPFLLMLEE